MAGYISAQNVEITLRIDGEEDHTVSGLSDDSDAVMMPADEDYATAVTGADGQILVVRQGNRGGEVTLKLLATSATTKHLMDHVTSLLGDDPPILKINELVINDRINGIVHTCRGGLMTKFPRGITFGAGAVNSFEFTFFFEVIVPNWEDFNPPSGIGIIAGGNIN